MSNEDDVELGIEECWAIRRTAERDRAGVPDRRRSAHHAVNYRVDQPLLSAPPRAPRRSMEVGMLFAFEIDEVTGGFARSVIARGTARRLPDAQDERVELTPVDRVSARSPPKYDVVAIIAEAPTGRKVAARHPKHWRAPSLVEFSRHAR